MIKNNLSDICGMLQIERSENDDVVVQRILLRTEKRLIAALKLHELLYEAQSLVEINLKDYIEQLVDKIYQISKEENSHVSYDIQIEEINMEISQVFPLGLIVNELISNAMQHAFQATKDGVIMVDIHRENEDIIHMSVSDNGDGMELHNINEEDSSNYSLEIIQLLANRLNAKFNLRRDNGTTFELTFNTCETDNLSIGRFRRKSDNNIKNPLPAIN